MNGRRTLALAALWFLGVFSPELIADDASARAAKDISGNSPATDSWMSWQRADGLTITVGSEPNSADLLTHISLVVAAGTEFEGRAKAQTAGRIAQVAAKGAAADTQAPDESQIGAAELVTNAATEWPNTFDQPSLRDRLALLGAAFEAEVGTRDVTLTVSVVPERATTAAALLLSVLAGESTPEPIHSAWSEEASHSVTARAALSTDPLVQASLIAEDLLGLELTHRRRTPSPHAAQGFFRHHWRPERAVLSLWGLAPPQSELQQLARTTLRAELPAPDLRSPPLQAPARSPGHGTRGNGSPARPARLSTGPTQGSQAGPSRAQHTELNELRCIRSRTAGPAVVLVSTLVAVPDSAAYFGLEMLAGALGASHDSRLHRRLRVNEELVYTVEARVVPRESGVAQLLIVSQSDEPDAVVRAIVDELQRLAKNGLEEPEVIGARNLLVSRLLLDSESAHGAVKRRAMERLGWPSPRSPETAIPVVRALDAGHLSTLASSLDPERIRLARVIAAHDLPPSCRGGAANPNLASPAGSTSQAGHPNEAGPIAELPTDQGNKP